MTSTMSPLPLPLPPLPLPPLPDEGEMVPQPTPDSSLVVRRPPSVTSRARTARTHRYHRSHYGISSAHPQNDFPVFTYTGDVEIIVKAGVHERRYLLHRLILAQCSGFFDASTSEPWSKARTQTPMPIPTSTQNQASSSRAAEGDAKLTTREESGGALSPGMTSSGTELVANGKMRWRYELDWANAIDGEFPILRQKDPASISTIFGDGFDTRSPPIRSKQPPQSNGFFNSVANLTLPSTSNLTHSNSEPVDPIIRDYDNLFRIFYNYAPSLDASNIAGAYSECKSLLALADMYDALEVVGPRIDYHMLRFSRQLYKQIAKYPPSYLKLGYLARSKTIFAEALVHVVGQWPAGAHQLQNGVPDVVLDIIEDKVEELEEVKTKVESKLFRLTLTTSRGERVSPTNAYMDWLAVSLFRQWLAENTTPPPAPILKNRTADGQPAPAPHQHHKFNTGKIYRMMGMGGQAYLPHDELKKFLKLRPEYYSRDVLKKFERRMEEIKHLASDVVKPLMRNSLELDISRDGGGLGYLTCTKVDEVDYPWE